MFSLRNHFADDQVCELGGELIDTGHARIRALAAELGLTLDDLSADPTAAFGDVWFSADAVTAKPKSCANSRRWPPRSRAMPKRFRTSKSPTRILAAPRRSIANR